MSESQFRTVVGREFPTDGVAVLKELLSKDVCLKGTCSSGADNDCSDLMLLVFASCYSCEHNVTLSVCACCYMGDYDVSRLIVWSLLWTTPVTHNHLACYINVDFSSLHQLPSSMVSLAAFFHGIIGLPIA